MNSSIFPAVFFPPFLRYLLPKSLHFQSFFSCPQANNQDFLLFYQISFRSYFAVSLLISSSNRQLKFIASQRQRKHKINLSSVHDESTLRLSWIVCKNRKTFCENKNCWKRWKRLKNLVNCIIGKAFDRGRERRGYGDKDGKGWEPMLLRFERVGKFLELDDSYKKLG
jgi:hypothetical protein